MSAPSSTRLIVPGSAKAVFYLGATEEPAALPVMVVADTLGRPRAREGGDPLQAPGAPESLTSEAPRRSALVQVGPGRLHKGAAPTSITPPSAEGMELDTLVPTHLVALWLDVHPRTLLRWCQQRRFPPPAVGGDAQGRTKYWTMRVVLEQYELRHGSQARVNRSARRRKHD